jgi:hypothetical protein
MQYQLGLQFAVHLQITPAILTAKQLPLALAIERMQMGLDGMHARAVHA